MGRLLFLMVSAASLLLGCQHVAPSPISASETGTALLARSLADPGLRDFLEAHLEAPLAEWPLRRWNLDQLTLAALYEQPTLSVARARAHAAGAAIVTAAERPNPNLAVSPEFSANPGVGVSPWLATVQLDWPIETAGKRDRRIERAEAQTDAATLAIPVEAWRVRQALRTALVELVAAKARESVLRAEVREMGRRDALFLRRVEAGAASQVEASLARVARIQADVDLAAARRQRLEAMARLAGAIGVPEEALADVELDFPLDPGGNPLLDLDEEQARRDALHTRSDVLVALAQYGVAEATIRLELAKQYPDIHLGRGYQFDEGQNKWALAISLDLPVMNRNEGPIAESVAAREEARAQLVATQARVIAEIEQALAHRRGATEEAHEMERLMNERAARLAQAQEAFDLGAADRLTLADAEIELRRAQRAHLDAQARVQQALAELEASIEGPLASWDAIAGSNLPQPAAGQP